MSDEQITGSPLRVQGKVDSLFSLAYFFLFSFSEDHPCVCREKHNIADVKINAVGSPLRVQGKD